MHQCVKKILLERESEWNFSDLLCAQNLKWQKWGCYEAATRLSWSWSFRALQFLFCSYLQSFWDLSYLLLYQKRKSFFSRKTLAIVGIRTQTLIRVAFEYKALLACQIVVIQQKQPGGFVKQSFKNIIFKPQSCLLNGAVIRKSSCYISLHYKAPLKQSPSAI